jgi:hypothetical protein
LSRLAKYPNTPPIIAQASPSIIKPYLGRRVFRFGGYGDYINYYSTPGNNNLVVFAGIANNFMNFTLSYLYQETVTDTHTQKRP